MQVAHYAYFSQRQVLRNFLEEELPLRTEAMNLLFLLLPNMQFTTNVPVVREFAICCYDTVCHSSRTGEYIENADYSTAHLIASELRNPPKDFIESMEGSSILEMLPITQFCENWLTIARDNLVWCELHPADYLHDGLAISHDSWYVDRVVRKFNLRRLVDNAF